MIHARFVAATVAIGLALAGCGGGGSSSNRSVLPSVPQSGAPAPVVPQSIARDVLSDAPRGVRVTIHLPLRNSAQLDDLIKAQSDKSSPQYHHFLTPDQFRATYGPAASDLQSVATALTQSGFTVTTTSQGVIAEAPQAVVEKTFQTRLHTVPLLSRRTISSALVPQTSVTLPAALARVNAVIPSFFGREGVHLDSHRSSQPVKANFLGPEGPYFADDLKQAYHFPSVARLNGTGRTIGIVIPSDVSDSDTAAYFHFLGLPPPRVLRRPVDGPIPPFDPNGNGFEATLDVQMSGGSAPGATIVLYAPQDLSDNEILNAYQAVVEDNKADIVSSSFGECELFFTAPYQPNNKNDFAFLRAASDIFRQGNAQGITFFASSGDFGARGCPDVAGTTMLNGVEWPAADPNVVGVGGTNLVTTDSSQGTSRNSAYVRESAFADPVDPSFFVRDFGVPLANGEWGSGGGVSTIYAKPLYQQLVNTGARMRSVPDVAYQMGGCPGGAITCSPDDSAVIVVLGGGLFGAIGTSASSPAMAGLLALTEQNIGGVRAGNVNFEIYIASALNNAEPGGIYRQNIPGNNGYATHRGYNFVLGNGTPLGSNFALAPEPPFAGLPGTPSNP